MGHYAKLPCIYCTFKIGEVDQLNIFSVFKNMQPNCHLRLKCQKCGRANYISYNR